MAVRQLVSYPTGTAGEIVVFEVVPVQAPGEQPAARTAEVVHASKRLDEALEQVRPAAASLLAKVRDLAEPPDEAAFEFGVKLTAKAGAIVAATAAEANFKVTLTWKRA